MLITLRADAGVFISVDASPQSLPANGKSYSQILVTVLEQTGVPVPDNTEVRLTTSAGDITPIVYTSGGRAVGILTSSAIPQIAVITAIANGITSSAQVEFSSSDSEEVTPSARTIRMSGGTLAYSVDEDTVIGSSGVTVEYRNLTIQAASAQVSQAIGQIRAQGEVTIKKGEKTLTADALVCDTRTDKIRFLDLKDESSMRTFDITDLEQDGSESMPANPQAFSPMMDVDGKTWIVSRRLVLIPGDKIIFFKASIYVGDSKILTMPYYSYSYETRESILQQVRYTSNEGMLVDFPFYYHVADSSAGALKLRYAGSGDDTGGYFRPRRGLSMGLENEYSIGSRSQGRVFVDSVGNSTRAFELAHRLEYGSAFIGGRVNVSARYQPTSRYGKDIYSTSLSIAGSLKDYNYIFSGYFSGSSIPQPDLLDPETIDYISQSNSSLRAILRPKSPIILDGFGRLSPSLILGYGNLWSSDKIVSPSLYQSIGLNFSRNQVSKGNTYLSFDGAMGFTVTAKGDTGSSLRMGPTLRNNWTGGSASLSYTLNLHDGTTDSISGLSKHQLGGNLYFNMGGKLNSYLSANYGLDSKRLNLYSTLNYTLSKDWQIRSSYDLYRYSYELNNESYSYKNSYLKVGIYRPLGQYEIGLAWSPNGRNYGIDKDKHLWLEFNGREF